VQLKRSLMSVWPELVDLALDEAPLLIGSDLLAQGCFPDFGIRTKNYCDQIISQRRSRLKFNY